MSEITNIFVICPGRSGSSTFAEALRQHGPVGWTVGHELRKKPVSRNADDIFTRIPQLQFPAKHIEIDNRLGFMLGSLIRQYAQSALYVYLHRNQAEIVSSFLNHPTSVAINSFRRWLMWDTSALNEKEIIEFYVQTVRRNFEMLYPITNCCDYWLDACPRTDNNNANQDFYSRVNVEHPLLFDRFMTITRLNATV